MALQELCAYEIIRRDNIAEREKEWVKLVESKKEFDASNDQVKIVKKRKTKKQETQNSLTLRRSSRVKPTVEYKESKYAGNKPTCYNVQLDFGSKYRLIHM